MKHQVHPPYYSESDEESEEEEDELEEGGGRRFAAAGLAAGLDGKAAFLTPRTHVLQIKRSSV
mgnify:CR=1 FL=1